MEEKELKKLQEKLIKELKDIGEYNDLRDFEKISVSQNAVSIYEYLSSYIDKNSDIDSLVLRYIKTLKERCEAIKIRLENIDKLRLEKYIDYYTEFYVSKLKDKFKSMV